MSEPPRLQLQRLALRLEYATIGWNLGEAVITIGLGMAAASLALIGFGFDSIIEVFASAVVVWHIVPGHAIDNPVRTVRALRLVGVAFGFLAVMLAGAAVRDLIIGRRPEESFWGIVYLAAAAAVMVALALVKMRLARQLNSAPLRSEATLTALDAALATGTMVGLLLNAALGWWWADPVAALLVAVVAANEARESWQEAAEHVLVPSA